MKHHGNAQGLGRGGQGDVEQEDGEGAERAGERGAVLGVYLPFDGREFHGAELARLRALDARAGEGRAGARDEDLRLHPRVQRQCNRLRR